MKIAGAQYNAICLKQMERTKGIAASTGRGTLSDKNVKDNTNSPSMIELYLVSFILEESTGNVRDR